MYMRSIYTHNMLYISMCEYVSVSARACVCACLSLCFCDIVSEASFVVSFNGQLEPSV